jgi:hypothetical protein
MRIILLAPVARADENKVDAGLREFFWKVC